MALDDQIIGVSVPDVSAGQNSKDHARVIDPNQAASLKNVVLNRGLRKKRGGTTLAGGIGGSNRVTGLQPFLPTGGIPVLLRTQGINLEKWPGSGDWERIGTGIDSIQDAIPVGGAPIGIAITPDGNFAYVCNSTDGTVSKIRLSDNTVVATITVGSTPDDIDILQDGTKAYVTNSASNTVSVIALSSDTVIATITVGNQPRGLKSTPDSSEVWAINLIDATISVIATSTDTVSTTIIASGGVEWPVGIDVTPAGDFFYVSQLLASDVLKISQSSKTISATIAFAVGDQPWAIAITPNGVSAYVGCHGTDLVKVITLSSDTITASIPVGDEPRGVVVKPDGAHVYVANFGTTDNISRIETAGNTVDQTLSANSDPYWLAAHPDGFRVYVSNQGVDTVQMINDASFTSDRVTNFVVAKDLAFLLNGIDNVHSYDGTNLTDEGDTNVDPAKGSIGEYMQERLFIVGQDSSIVYFSEPLLPQTFDRTVNQFSFVTGDNTNVTAIKRATNRELLTWKESSIHTLILAGSDPANDWFIEDIDREHGAVATRTVQQAGSDFFFLSESGVRSLFRTELDKPRAASIPVSDPIEDFIERINPAAIHLCSAHIFKNRYYLSVPLDTSPQNNATFVYDIINRGWVEDTAWLPAVWATMNFGQGRKLFWGNSATSAKVFEAEDGTFNDDGAAISFEEEGARHMFRLNSNDKRFRHVEVQAVATGDSSLRVFAQIDAGGYVQLGTMELLGDFPQLPIDLPFELGGNAVVKKKFSVEALGKGRDLQVKLEHDDLNEDCQILSVEAFTHVDDYKYNAEAP